MPTEPGRTILRTDAEYFKTLPGGRGLTPDATGAELGNRSDTV